MDIQHFGHDAHTPFDLFGVTQPAVKSLVPVKYVVSITSNHMDQKAYTVFTQETEANEQVGSHRCRVSRVRFVTSLL